MKRGLRSLSELFNYLESKQKWADYYFEIQNDFDISASVGQHSKNMYKNRYCNVWPWDKNRVLLPNGGYINASLVTSPVAGGNQYICTQEPLTGPDSTKEDFWQMIWHTGCQVIIMLNDPSENNSYFSKEYYPYFPTGSHGYHEYKSEQGTRVKLISREDNGSFVHSKLQLSVHNDTYNTRNITHLQFKGWKDYAIPSSAAEFHSFLTFSRSHFDPLHGGPPVIHCSAGVGRTGTFVLADVVLKLAAQQGSTQHIDVQKVLTDLRRDRMWLVQTPDQLRFCFQTILEGLKYCKVEDSGHPQE